MIKKTTNSLLQIGFIIYVLSLCTHLYAQESTIIISEFSASNNKVLLDKDGESSDWIELFNTTTETISLQNWGLTDDENILLKWKFPNVSMDAGEFFIVFASGKDLNNPNSELHTNFKLSSGGEYLALVKSDGQTKASEFSPSYDEQYGDISYGFIQNSNSTVLLSKNTSAKLLIPNATDNSQINNTWTGLNEPFDDSSWETVFSSIGYDKRDGTVGNENIALLKTAIHSSEWPSFSANLANDGILNNFSHTADGDLSPWWLVDLGESFNIGRVIISNRSNCCQSRLYNITVEILDALDNIVYTSQVLNSFTEGQTPISPGASITLNIFEHIPNGVLGSKVRISKTSVTGEKEYLTLAEVEVYDMEQRYNDEILTDVEDKMLAINSSAYLRIPFQVVDEEVFNALLLKMKYNDGFVAYLNGIRVASANAPDGQPVYNEIANAEHLDSTSENFFIPVNLLKQGENVLAIHGLNLDLNDDSFLIEPELEALDITTTNTLVYFEEPTPKAVNGAGVSGIVLDTKFDFDRGFYDSAFELTISSETSGATIIYTTDGSNPSETNGVKINPANSTTPPSGPISITKTTVVRAIAVKPNFRSTDIDTQTYIFIEDVIANGVMDTNITQDAKYAPQMEGALIDLPSVSIVIHPGTLNKVEDSFASLEWIMPDGESGFQENMGVRYFGGEWAGPFAKQNFRLYFRSKYGKSKLNFPLFKDHENGIEPVEIFDQLELRAGSHDMVQRGFYMSNRFTDDTMLDMGNLNPHGRFVHLYLNGTYWGQYHLRERWNADMLAQYLGGEKEDYEAVSGNKNIGGWADPGKPYDGDGSAWTRVKSLRDNYKAVKPYLDVEHYIDYMLMFMFGNSEDEYRCAGPTTAGSGFKFFLNDADGYLRDAGNRTAMAQPGLKNADGPGSIFSMLFNEGDTKYKLLLADRIHKHFFNIGAMTPEKIEERLLKRTDQIELAFIAEAARWGYRTPDSWEEAKEDYINDVIPNRTNTVINQFKNAGFYPTVDAPLPKINEEFNYGGIVNLGDELSLTSLDAEIYYTLDGSDPFLPGDKNADLFTIVSEDISKSILIPTGELPSGWNTEIDFDDSTWIKGNGSFGYDLGNEPDKVIGINTEAMRNSQTSCIARIKFNLAQNDLNSINKLLLYMSFDDGAVVYLNGLEVLRMNFDGTPVWNSTATTAIEANTITPFNITDYLSNLKTGDNILAIHGLNVSLSSSDFFISTKLVGDKGVPSEDIISPKAIRYDGAFEINQTTLINARAIFNDEWSALSVAEYTIEGENTVEELRVRTYPNPFNDNVNIEFQATESTMANLQVYDIRGRLVWENEFPVMEKELKITTVDATNWSNGMYIYKFGLSSGEWFSGKIICNKRR